MITIRNNKVEFNNPNIVKYFAKYYNIPKFLKSCETVLETFCVNTDDFLQNYTESQKHDLLHLIIKYNIHFIYYTFYLHIYL